MKQMILVTALVMAVVAQLYAVKKTRVRVVIKEDVFTGAPFRQCHAPTLAETAPGTVLAAWFAGSYEGAPDACIWTAKRQHGRWSSPARVACGNGIEGNPIPCWNPVLFTAADHRKRRLAQPFQPRILLLLAGFRGKIGRQRKDLAGDPG